MVKRKLLLTITYEVRTLIESISHMSTMSLESKKTTLKILKIMSDSNDILKADENISNYLLTASNVIKLSTNLKYALASIVISKLPIAVTKIKKHLDVL